MENDEKEKLKDLINQKLEKLETQVIELKELTKPIAPENAIGRISRMDAINNRTINEEALRKAKNQIISLKSSLENIDSPDFGKCIKCGNEIPSGRILIVPESRKCVNCL